MDLRIKLTSDRLKEEKIILELWHYKRRKHIIFSCTCKRPQENEDSSNWQNLSAYILGEQREATVRKEWRQELFSQGLFVQNTHSKPLAPLIKMFPLGMVWKASFTWKESYLLLSGRMGRGRAGGGGCGQSILLPPAIFLSAFSSKQSLCPSGIFCHSFNSIGSHIVLTLGHKIHNLYM